MAENGIRKDDISPAQSVKILFNETAIDQSDVEKAIKTTLEPLGFRFVITVNGPVRESEMYFERDLTSHKENQNG